MTRDEIYSSLRSKLRDVVPEIELRYKAELAYEIIRLKKEKNALILGHHYMEPALYHSIVDITGDSLELSRAAAQADNKIIVFCGVRFMAETAKILNPGRTVLLPSDEAGCSLADEINAEDVRRLKAEYPGAPVVAYINTSAAVKAEADICCTSGNAVSVIQSLDAENVIFLPDEYMARNVAKETGRQIIVPVRSQRRAGSGGGPKYRIISWHGRCEVHEKFSTTDVENVRKQFPDALILAHPECRPEVVAASDFSGGTSAMVRYIRESAAQRYLLLTECAMGENVAAAFPEKGMLRLCSVRCPHMNKITLETTLESLRSMKYVIEIPEDIRANAARALERMLVAAATDKLT
ncbi:MAG: quinolinate synthase NadA [Ignavibacteria bacterium]|nr:quinolinate synthase NadA [Ignavibacteria bacterium]